MAIKAGGGTLEPMEEGGAEIVAEINITPLTDIFLVLLIIFMVTSSVMSQMGVNVNLPQASTATSESQPDGVIVTLLPAGGIQVNGRDFKAGEYGAFEDGLKGAFGKTAS